MWRKSIFYQSQEGKEKGGPPKKTMLYCCYDHPGLLDTGKADLFIAVVVIGVYLDSYLFVFATAIMKYGLGLDSANVCNGAIYLCLVAYITSKVRQYTACLLPLPTAKAVAS